jgi:hypothetical protein
MRRFLVFGTFLLALSACDGTDATGPRGNVGALRFSAQGGARLPAATYDARGQVELDPSGEFALGEWAFGRTGAAHLVVVASQPAAAGGGRHDMVTLFLPPGVRAGTTFAPVRDCAFGVPRNCAELFLSFGVTLLDVAPEFSCSWTGGQVRVAERTRQRIRGTFSGTASCGSAEGTIGETIHLTGGSFDVPVRDDVG